MRRHGVFSLSYYFQKQDGFQGPYLIIATSRQGLFEQNLGVTVAKLNAKQYKSVVYLN